MLHFDKKNYYNSGFSKKVFICEMQPIPCDEEDRYYIKFKIIDINSSEYENFHYEAMTHLSEIMYELLMTHKRHSVPVKFHMVKTDLSNITRYDPDCIHAVYNSNHVQFSIVKIEIVREYYCSLNTNESDDDDDC